MVDRRDIELVLRATDQSSRQFADVKRAVEGITTALNAQLQSAEKGEAAFEGFADQLKELKTAADALTKQQLLIDTFRNLGTQLETATAKARDSRAAHAALAATYEEGAKKTKAQKEELAGLDSEAKKAERSVKSLTESLARQTEKLAAAGIAVETLEQTQQELVNTAQLLGTTRAAAIESEQRYTAAIKASTEAEKAQKAALAEAIPLIRARMLVAQEAARAAERERQLNDDPRKALAAAINPIQVRAAVQNSADARAARAQPVAEILRAAAEAAAERQKLAAAAEAAAAKDAAAIAKTLEGYRKLADQLGQTTQRFTTLGDVSSTITERVSRVSEALLRVSDPGAAQRSTITGLEDQVTSLGTAILAAKGPVKDYEVQLRLLAAAQQSAADKGRIIDAYQQQVAVVRAARAEFVAARTAVNDYATQLRSATAPNDELKAKAAAAATALAAASREMQNQFARAAQLREGLVGAGLDTAKLAEEERKLINVSREATIYAERLSKQFQSEGRSTAGNGLFGLSPYAIQNLGYQLNDVFVQLSSGTSLLQTLSQQGPQILQGLPGAFRAIGQNIAVILPAVAGLTAAFAVLSRAIDDLAQSRAFAGFLQASVDGTNYQTAALVELQRTLRDFGNTSEEATQALRTFVDAGIRPDRLRSFALAAQDIVDLFGGKLPDAAKRLAEGFTGGYAEVAKLNEQFHFLTASQAERIQKLFEEGHGAEALSEAFRLLRERQSAAADTARGEFTTAMRDGRAAVSDLIGLLSDSGWVRLWVANLRSSALSVSYLVNAIRGARRAATEESAPGVTGTGAPPGGDQGVSEAQRTRGQDFLREQAERFAAADRQNAQLRIELAGRAALAEAQSKGLSIGDQQRAQAAAIANAVREQGRAEDDLIDAETRRGDSTRTLTREEKIRADGQRAYDAARRIGATEGVRELAREAAELATTRELNAAEGSRIEALRNRLNMTREMTAAQRIAAAGEEAARKAREAGDTADGIREQRELAEEIKRREIAREGVGAANARVNLERELQNELSQLRSTADRQERTQLDTRLRAIDERYARIFQNIDRLRTMGAESVQGQPISAFAAEVEAQKELLKNNETLKFYEDALTATVKERKEAYRDIAERQRAGEIDGAQAFREQETVTARLTPRMRQLADEAVRFAQSLRGADPNPRIDAAIARFQRLGNTDRGQGGTDAAGREGANAAVAEQMRKVNELFAQRTSLVESYTRQAATGQITQLEADEKIRSAYEKTNEEIQQNIRGLREVNDATQGVRTAAEVELTSARIQEMNANLAYTSPLLKTIKGAFEQAFTQGIATAFDSLAQSLGGLIAGTKSWGDVLRDAGNIGLQFMADLLRSIALAIIKFYALRLASEAMKAVGLGTEAVGSGLEAAGAAATTAAAGALGTASGVLVLGASELGISAATLAAAAQLLIVANSMRAAGGVAHEGGIAGSLLRTRPVSPSWFIGAPRYHGGGMAGLAPNEIPAILERGEEVLDTKNPRHIINAAKGGAAAGGRGGGPTSIRNVLVMDPKAIPEAMTGSHGEAVTVTHIRRNLPAIRQMLKGA